MISSKWILVNKSKSLFLVLYVNDIFVADRDKDLLETFLAKLKKEFFRVKPSNYFLDMQLR